MSARPIRLLSVTLLALVALAACKGEKPAAPPKPAAVQAPAAPTRTRDQAIAELMALPELKTWSEQIEKRSHGAAHGAVIEDDPNPRVIDGKQYYQLSFVEDRKQDVHRRASFLVAHQGDEILVEDVDNDTVQSLSEWRRSIRNIELKSG
ncbi:hypothetical protein [Massilia rhizosphaerae]|uniref:hypothetical protein n=1 Tax=Massilia rhizosphaerae TaxID=2784389 RepID=UPI0018DD5B10|nr:hypothetical protein [Massilia rhizosphaerae]